MTVLFGGLGPRSHSCVTGVRVSHYPWLGYGIWLFPESQVVFIFILFQTAESSVPPPLSLVNWDALCSVQEVISGIIP